MFNQLCESFDLDVPVFAFTHSREVVAAVSAAGGLGVLGGASMTPSTLESALSWLDERCPGQYGVDLIFPAKSAGGDEAQLRAQIPAAQQAFSDAVQREFGVPERTEPPGATTLGGMPTEIDHLMSHANAQALWAVAREHSIKLLVSALGPLPEDVRTDARQRGMLIGGIIGAPRHATKQVEWGVDLLIAQGTEAGGHTGTVSTLVVVPQIVEAARGVPVLAAGGIATGSQIAAALALGAQGVWMGSAWLATTESDTHPIVKQKIIAAGSDDVAITLAVTGKPTRQLKTEWTEAWLRPDAPQPLPSPVQQLLARDPVVSAFEHDNPAFMGSALGQAAVYVTRQEPVADVMSRLRRELASSLGALARVDVSAL